MKKEFNITGVCVPEINYMVDISDKITGIEEMVDKGYCFVISKPRQYGKTTILNELSKKLNSRYVVLFVSFEAVSNKIFENEENFSLGILKLLTDNLRMTPQKDVYEILSRHQEGVKDFDGLSITISEFIDEIKKEVVLIIDEIDKNGNNGVFLKFLSLLRRKYLSKQMGKDITFKSVILAGVYDIKNLSTTIKEEEEEIRFNSPFNIAMDFDIDISFSDKDIETMLSQYVNEEKLTLNVEEMSRKLYEITSGYPYLVSKMAYIMDKKLQKKWDIEGLQEAIDIIISEKNPLFDYIIGIIERNSEIRNILKEIFVDGGIENFTPYVYEKAIIHGILVERDGKLVIHNKIFEGIIFNFLMDRERAQSE
ncbi:AAA-like domain-containing protein [Clostridium cellulovorans]|nr:AAA-like domain-containing protein [Clostridium cellulovorans]